MNFKQEVKIVMSHFSKIKTSLKNLETLQHSLTEIGVEWFSEFTCNNILPEAKEFIKIVIPQQNSQNITFEWNGKNYELVADLSFWQQPLSVDAFIERVTQKYAYQTIITEAQKNGFNMIEESKEKDGTIHLVMNRWFT
uniref:Uncharacterized protein ycf35 n=1 Tax=Sciadococcus taiwanensis TaxID=3028030 RepID=A0A9Y1I208_9RHOD|nr:DUF1257 domain-containing protein [Sciadococcus taiwanensis]